MSVYKKGLAGMFSGLNEPLDSGTQDSPQNSVQTNTQDHTQIDTQESTQKETRNSTQNHTQDNTHLCVQVESYLRPKIEHDLQRKMKYMQITLRVEEDVGQALRSLTESEELPRGIQQAVANNGLRFVLEALGYMKPRS